MSKEVGFQGVYDCIYCNRCYKRKINYDKHILLCKIYRKGSIDMDKDNVLSMHEMSVLIKYLLECQQRNDTKYKRMLSLLNSKKKINVLEWLNENIVNCTDYMRWLSGIVITEYDMETIFKYDFLEGMKYILSRICLNDNGDISLPIKSFEHKEGVLFIYINNAWVIMSSNSLVLLINTITKGLTKEFKLWQDKNKHRLYDNNFTDIYISNLKKVTGGNLSQEQQNNQIKKFLYNILKMKLIEYELTF